MTQFMNAGGAAAMVRDGATVAISGNGAGMASAEAIFAAVERRFLETGHPRDLTLVHSLGIGRLAETIGLARARHMLLLGDPISAGQALEWGLITALAEDGADLERQVDGWLDTLCANAPAAMALTKRVLSVVHRDLRGQHIAAAAEAAATEDCHEGVLAFREKRKPVFHNR